jgi:hypothetical protein
LSLALAGTRNAEKVAGPSGRKGSATFSDSTISDSGFCGRVLRDGKANLPFDKLAKAQIMT